MKLYKHLFILISLGFLVSCGSSKNISEGTNVVKKMSARRVVKKHLAVKTPKTIDAKLKVNYKDTKENLGFSVRMKIQKDQVIWLKGTKLITIFKAKITPKKVSFYSPYKKNYFEGDFSMLKELLGVDIDFYQLQNLLLGQSLFNLKKNKQQVEIVEQAYQLSPKKQQDLYAIFYKINPEHFKVQKQYVVNPLKAQRLDINYPKYQEKDSFILPKEIKIQAKEKNKFTNIDINLRSITLNKKLSMPFKIPTGYKEIKL